MLSALCLNLDQSKILSSGNGIKDRQVHFRVVKGITCLCFLDKLLKRKKISIYQTSASNFSRSWLVLTGNVCYRIKDYISAFNNYPVWFNRGYKNKPLQSRDRHICHFIWRNKSDSMHVVKGDKRGIILCFIHSSFIMVVLCCCTCMLFSPCIIVY